MLLVFESERFCCPRATHATTVPSNKTPETPPTTPEIIKPFSAINSSSSDDVGEGIEASFLGELGLLSLPVEEGGIVELLVVGEGIGTMLGAGVGAVTMFVGEGVSRMGARVGANVDGLGVAAS